jgi:tRNA A-37 threonylcarbamoyl transferase component Bud32
MAASTPILPPRYRDVERIASGGMGEIYRAVDEELGRPVVVKVMSEGFAQDDSLRQRFKREALAAARLSGAPNTVTIFDVGEHDSRPFIVMEYLRGGSLQDRVGGNAPCDPAQVLEWLEDAATGLDVAHREGIVHRDVKPANLLLDDRGRLYVADFGIASAAGLDSFTKTGTILGTAGYLAPEQAQGKRAGAASDRYALAVVAFELLAGRRPFEAGSATAEAAAHIQQPVPSAHELNPNLPPELDRVFERALAKDPDARYPTAAEFVAELRHALHESAGATAIAEPTWPTRVIEAPRHARRWWIPVLAALVVAAGVVAAVAATRDDGKQATPTERTVVRTVTRPGTTVERMVTTAPAATTRATQQETASGEELNNAGYERLVRRDVNGALPLLEQAVQKLQGTGSLAEAYASYNLALARFALGRCDGVIELLDRSQAIQGRRKEIDRLRKNAERRCDERR